MFPPHFRGAATGPYSHGMGQLGALSAGRGKSAGSGHDVVVGLADRALVKAVHAAMSANPEGLDLGGSRADDPVDVAPATAHVGPAQVAPQRDRAHPPP